MNKIELARFFDSDSSKIRTVTISDYEKMIAKQDKDASLSLSTTVCPVDTPCPTGTREQNTQSNTKMDFL
jgi:hypothetical protein